MITPCKGLSALFCCLLLSACDSEPESVDTDAGDTASAPAPTAEVEDSCAPDGELTYICGLQNAEDILALGDTGMLLASGMSRDNIVGHLYLIDPRNDSYRELIYGGGFGAELDGELYPNCPGLINLRDYSMHGLSLREYEPGRFDLYVTSHGAREAIEVFDLDMSGDSPSLSWQGCVPMPEDSFTNSIAILDDGGFVATKMMDPAEGFEPVSRGEITGLVYEWHPGGNVTTVEGTELSGANGITLSDDEQFMYVAAFGSGEFVRFDRSVNPVYKTSVSLDIMPDNVRWGANGMLLTAGGNAAGDGWSVVEIDPDTLAVERIGVFDSSVALQNVSSALQIGDEIWVGTFNGDRVGHFPR